MAKLLTCEKAGRHSLNKSSDYGKCSQRVQESQRPPNRHVFDGEFDQIDQTPPRNVHGEEISSTSTASNEIYVDNNILTT